MTVAAHHCDDSMAAIAARILASAPPRFGLVGLSMGGYISFEIMRQAPQRIARLALLDTMALPDTPEASSARRTQMALAESGTPRAGGRRAVGRGWCTPGRQGDRALRALGGAMAARRRHAGLPAASRPPTSRGPTRARPSPAIRCPTLVLVGDRGRTHPAGACGRDRQRHRRRAAGARSPPAATCRRSSSPDEVDAGTARLAAAPDAAHGRNARAAPGAPRASGTSRARRCGHISVGRAVISASQTCTCRYMLFGRAGAACACPAPAPGGARVDGLWQHTCFEAFVRLPDPRLFRVQLLARAATGRRTASAAIATAWRRLNPERRRRGLRRDRAPERLELSATVHLGGLAEMAGAHGCGSPWPR